MTIRYAIWAAFSKKRQAAKDKASLPEQIRRSRALDKSRGWIESAGPFLVPGESRTQYIDITIAERSIPALKDMLDSAERGEFDVIICHDLTRFRNLGRQIADVLADSRVQIYSLRSRSIRNLRSTSTRRMPIAPVSCKTHPEWPRRAEIMIKVERWRGGIRGRVEEGLAPTGNLHYGYRNPSTRNIIPRPYSNPIHRPPPSASRSRTSSFGAIAHPDPGLPEYQAGPSPRGGRWNYLTVRYILRNPYYAGLIEWGRVKTHAKRRIGKGRFEGQSAGK